MQTNWICARRKAPTTLTAKAAVSQLGPVLRELKCQGSEETRNGIMQLVPPKKQEAKFWSHYYTNPCSHLTAENSKFRELTWLIQGQLASEGWFMPKQPLVLRVYRQEAWRAVGPGWWSLGSLPSSFFFILQHKTPPFKHYFPLACTLSLVFRLDHQACDDTRCLYSSHPLLPATISEIPEYKVSLGCVCSNRVSVCED